MGFIDRGLVAPTLNSTAAASANTAALQAALDAKGRVEVVGDGVLWINDTLLIDDNTDFYVAPTITVKMMSGANKSLIINSRYLDSFTSVTVTWDKAPPPSSGYPSPTSTSGLIAKIGWTAHGLVPGDAIWLKGTAGTTDPAFFGVFQVVGIVDANAVYIALKVLPSAAPSGTITAKKANKNISVSGGALWDINAANNPGVGSGQALVLQRMPAIFCGVYNLKIRDWRMRDSYGFCLFVAAVAVFDIDGAEAIRNMDGENVNQDNVKIMGPAWDGLVKNVYGDSGDDMISIEPYASGFPNTDITGGGNCLDIRISNVRSQRTTQGSIIIYSHSSFLIDGVTYDGASGWVSPEEVGTASSMVKITSEAGVTNGLLGLISLENIRYEDDNSPAKNAIEVLGSVLMDHLAIRGFRNTKSTQAVTAQSLINIGPNCTVRMISDNGSRLWWGRTNMFYINVANGATVNNISVTHGQFKATSGGAARVIVVAGTVSKIAIDGCEIDRPIPVELLSNAAAGCHVSITNNRIESSHMIRALISAYLYFAGNALITMSSGVIYVSGDGTTRLICNNGGGNRRSSGGIAWLVRQAGTELVQMFNGFDIDLDVTALERANGQTIRNSNAAAGTLAAAGVVLCHGTASGSWKLLADTTKTY